MTNLARIPRAQERNDLPAGWSPALQQWFDDEADKAWRMTSAQVAREMDGETSIDAKVREIEWRIDRMQRFAPDTSLADLRRIAREALEAEAAETERNDAVEASVFVFFFAAFMALLIATGFVTLAWPRLVGEPTYRMEITE